MTGDFLDSIQQLQKEGKLPVQLTQRQMAAIGRSLQKYADSLGEHMTQTQLDAIRDAIAKATQSLTNPQEIQGTETGFNPAPARNAIADVLKEFSAEGLLAANNIDFALYVARQIALGAANYVKDGLDQGVVDEYPAWELLRVYDREVPRGFRKGPTGALIPVPDDDWPSRWAAAGGELYDGRMIALKSDEVWQNLGDGAGGYDDTLGNPFPPFAFNSGYDVNNISRAEAIQLGLMDADTEVRAPKMDLADLFAEVGR